MKDFFYSLIILSFLSCSSGEIYRETKEVPAKWTYEQGIPFAFEVNDTTTAFQMILNVEHGEAFSHQNLYTKILTILPNSDSLSDIVSLDVRQRSGKSNGKCTGSTCTVSFLIEDGAYFSKVGRHQINVFQHTRFDTITDINELELVVRAVPQNTN